MKIISISKKILFASSLLLGTSLSYTPSIQASMNPSEELEGIEKSTKKSKSSKALVPVSKKDLSIDNMPNEMLDSILSYFQPHELEQIARVSRTFYQLCNDAQAWRDLVEQAHLTFKKGVSARHTVMAAMKSGHFYVWEALGEGVVPSYALKIWSPALKKMDKEISNLNKRAYKRYEQGDREGSDELYRQASLLKQDFKRIKFLWTYYSYPRSLNSYSTTSLEHDDSSYITYKSEKEKTYAQLGDIVDGEMRTVANKFWGMEGEEIPRTKEDIARALILRAQMHLDGHVNEKEFKHHQRNINEAYGFLRDVIEEKRFPASLRAKAMLVMAKDMYWDSDSIEKDQEIYKMLTTAQDHLVSAKDKDEVDLYRARLRVDDRVDSKTLEDGQALEILEILAKSKTSKSVKVTARYMLAKMSFEERNPSLTKEEALKRIAEAYLNPNLGENDRKEAENIIYYHGGIKMWLSYKFSGWKE